MLSSRQSEIAGELAPLTRSVIAVQCSLSLEFPGRLWSLSPWVFCVTGVSWSSVVVKSMGVPWMLPVSSMLTTVFQCGDYCITVVRHSDHGTMTFQCGDYCITVVRHSDHSTMTFQCDDYCITVVRHSDHGTMTFQCGDYCITMYVIAITAQR